MGTEQSDGVDWMAIGSRIVQWGWLLGVREIGGGLHWLRYPKRWVHEGENRNGRQWRTLVHYCMIILSGHERWLSFLIVVVTLLSTRACLLSPG